MTMTVAQSTDLDFKCSSFSKSRARYCLAFGRYECKSPQCAQRACGLHVVRNDQGMYCPQCDGPVRAGKY